MTSSSYQNRYKTAQGGKKRKPSETLKTWAFDSVGPKKYAIQLKKAGNGNPFLKFVEGVPQEDGSFRKYSITIWSEDFRVMFQYMDEVRAYLNDNSIRTPKGHKYEPDKWKKRKAAKSSTR